MHVDILKIFQVVSDVFWCYYKNIVWCFSLNKDKKVKAIFQMFTFS